MKLLLLPLLAALALPNAVNANVDPKVHKLCLPAADYSGCIKEMSDVKNSGLNDKSKQKSLILPQEQPHKVLVQTPMRVVDIPIAIPLAI